MKEVTSAIREVWIETITVKELKDKFELNISVVAEFNGDEEKAVIDFKLYAPLNIDVSTADFEDKLDAEVSKVIVKYHNSNNALPSVNRITYELEKTF